MQKHTLANINTHFALVYIGINTSDLRESFLLKQVILKIKKYANDISRMRVPLTTARNSLKQERVFERISVPFSGFYIGILMF